MARKKKADLESSKQSKSASKKKEQSTTSKKSTKTNSKIKQSSSSNKSKAQKKGKALAWKDYIKQMLEQTKRELLQNVAQSIKNEADYMKHDIGDFYDHASNDRDRELALMITQRERTNLVQIEEALKRLDDDTYGICDSCMDEMGEDRLRVMPFAKLCLFCTIELERRAISII